MNALAQQAMPAEVPEVSLRELFPRDVDFFAFCFIAQGLEIRRHGRAMIVPQIHKRLQFNDAGELVKLQRVEFQPDGRIARYVTLGVA